MKMEKAYGNHQSSLLDRQLVTAETHLLSLQWDVLSYVQYCADNFIARTHQGQFQHHCMDSMSRKRE